MPTHALRLTGTRTEPRWLTGERTGSRADVQALQSPSDEANRWVLWAMEASLHLHTALPHIADREAAEQTRAAVVALDDMIRAVRRQSLRNSA